MEDLEKVGRIRNLSSKNQRERSIDITYKGDEFIFPVADGTAKLPGRDYDFREPTLRREQTVRSEDFSRELQGEPGESQPTESTDDVEARADFWSIEGDFIYLHHNEPQVQLYVPKVETFPIPLKCIDVARSTYTRWTKMIQQLFHLVHWWNTSQIPRETKREIIKSAESITRNLSRICFDRGWNLERRHSGC